MTTSWAGTAGPESLRALCDDDVRGFVAGGLLGADIPERRQIEACQQMFSRAEQHRGSGQTHLVDESRLRILSNGGHASAEADVHTPVYVLTSHPRGSIVMGQRRPGPALPGCRRCDEMKDGAAHRAGVDHEPARLGRCASGAW